MSTNTGAVSTTEIAALLAWARSLSEASANADANADHAERAAFQAAKATLLARITDQPDTDEYPQGTVCD
jgi:hypothetical protein